MTDPDSGFSLFETPIGTCAIAFGPDGLLGVQLPDASAEKLRARMRRLFPDLSETAPSPAAEEAIAGIGRLLAGEKRDLMELPLDMARIAGFNRAVYDYARAIPPGETRTYGEVAQALGEPRAAQAVGQALGQNPFTIVVPCHRVLAANGGFGGFSAYGGRDTKMQLLRIEGAAAAAQMSLF